MGWRTLINVDDLFYIVSTNKTFDKGWETMIFPSDNEGRILDLTEQWATHYRDEIAAARGHDWAVEHWTP